jgi:hypothetical protein
MPFARLRCTALRCVSHGSYAPVLNAHTAVLCARPQGSALGRHCLMRLVGAHHQKVLAGVERDVLDHMRVGTDLIALLWLLHRCSLHRILLRGCTSAAACRTLEHCLRQRTCVCLPACLFVARVRVECSRCGCCGVPGLRPPQRSTARARAPHSRRRLSASSHAA